MDEASSSLVVHLLVVAAEASGPVTVALLLGQTCLLLLLMGELLLQLETLTGELWLQECWSSDNLVGERRPYPSRLLELVELRLRIDGVVMLEALSVGEEVLELRMSWVEAAHSAGVRSVSSGSFFFLVIGASEVTRDVTHEVVQVLPRSGEHAGEEASTIRGLLLLLVGRVVVGVGRGVVGVGREVGAVLWAKLTGKRLIPCQILPSKKTMSLKSR